MLYCAVPITNLQGELELSNEEMDNQELTEQETTPAPAIVPPKPRKKDLSKSEEAALVTLHAMTEQAQRLVILEAWEGKAWKIAKKDSFETYCSERLGLTYSDTYLSSLVKAAKFERAVTGRSFNALKLGEIETGENVPKIPLRALLQITRLEDADKQKEVYDEYQGLRGDNSTRTPKEVAEELKRIVDREVRAANPDAPRAGRKVKAATNDAPPIEAEVVTRTKPDMTPVQAETYDGSDEQQAIEAGYGEYFPEDYNQAVYGETAGAATTHELPAVAPGATESGSEAEGGETATGTAQRLATLEAWMNRFVAACEGTENVDGQFRELYNEATEYQKQFGL